MVFKRFHRHLRGSIVLDGRSIRPDQAGVRRYFIGLLTALASNQSQSNFSWSIHLTQSLWDNLEKRLKEQISSNNNLKVTCHKFSGKRYVLFSPLPAEPSRTLTVFPDYYGSLWGTGDTAVIIHDLHFCVHPNTFSLPQRLFRWAIFGSYHIRSLTLLTISSSTQAEIKAKFPRLAGRTRMAGSGSTRDIAICAEIESLVGKNFVACIGTINAHKNIPTLLKAYRRSTLVDDGCILAICGNPGNAIAEVEGEIAALRACSPNADIRLLHGLSDAQINWVYAHARGIILASLYEGFGLTVAEAVSFGCPVAASDIPALREAGKDTALYFNPKDVAAITVALNKLVSGAARKSTPLQIDRQGFEHVVRAIEDIALTCSDFLEDV